MKNKNLLILIIPLLVIAFSLNVDAFGVGTIYMENNILPLQKGEVKDFKLELQNLVGGEDITLQAEMKQGSEIVELLDKSLIYDLPYGERKDVNLKFTIPDYVEVGHRYPVEISFKQVVKDEGGVQLAPGITKLFTVEVISPIPITTKATSGKLEFNLTTIIFLVIILIIIIAILTFIKKRRGK